MPQFAKAGTYHEVGLYSLGEAILKNGFKEAASPVSYTMTSVESAWAIQQHATFISGVAFIRGSGLEATIDTFALDYSPERLRDTFFRHVRMSAS